MKPLRRKYIARTREHRRECRVKDRLARAAGTHVNGEEARGATRAAIEAFFAGGKSVTQCPPGKPPRQRKNYRPRV